MKKFISLFTSGSLAGVLAILHIPLLFYCLIVIHLATKSTHETIFQPSSTQIFYAIKEILVIILFCYMYINFKKLHQHKILWIIIAANTLIPILYGMTHGYEMKIFLLQDIAKTILELVIFTIGFLLVDEEIKGTKTTEKIVNEGAIINETILPNYKRPGLTNTGLALILGINVIIFQFVRHWYVLFTTEEGFMYHSVYKYSALFLAGIAVYISACLLVIFSRGKYGLQRIGWLICIISSLTFFIPLLSVFDNFNIYTLNQVFLPLIFLFLSIRGFCLVHVDAVLQNHLLLQGTNIEGDKINYTENFYQIHQPRGITSSRLALASLIIYTPVIFQSFKIIQMIIEKDHNKIEALLLGIPLFLLISGYMFIYNSPSQPIKHSGWWWFSLVLNGIFGCFGLLVLLNGKTNEIVVTVCFVSVAIISYFGTIRAHLDDAYETRLT